MAYCPILLGPIVALDLVADNCAECIKAGCEWYERGCPAHPCPQVVAIEEELAALRR